MYIKTVMSQPEKHQKKFLVRAVVEWLMLCDYCISLFSLQMNFTITLVASVNGHFQIQYLKLRALQRRSYTHYFYEATVGAGLPIISTLRGLLETGDKILRIEGIFRFVFLLHQFVISRYYIDGSWNADLWFTMHTYDREKFWNK